MKPSTKRARVCPPLFARPALCFRESRAQEPVVRAVPESAGSRRKVNQLDFFTVEVERHGLIEREDGQPGFALRRGALGFPCPAQPSADVAVRNDRGIAPEGRIAWLQKAVEVQKFHPDASRLEVPR